MITKTCACGKIIEGHNQSEVDNNYNAHQLTHKDKFSESKVNKHRVVTLKAIKLAYDRFILHTITYHEMRVAIEKAFNNHDKVMIEENEDMRKRKSIPW